MKNNDPNKILQTYRDCVKNLVSAKRYKHTLAVEQQAKKLAKIYGADEFKASAAAILHDIAKEMPPEEQISLIEATGVEFGEDEHQNQKLWHAAAGAAYAKSVLKVKDDEILNAILNHTTGRADMALLEKIVLVADIISDDREYSNVENLRAKAETSLEEVIEAYSVYIMAYLKENNLYISEKTKAACNCYSKFDK
ncbi:MAG: bis(5'-nucleosyl)-tetraphosphatase (symmetrical) YqeK [Oscillospiraceae bacterium]